MNRKEALKLIVLSTIGLCCKKNNMPNININRRTVLSSNPIQWPALASLGTLVSKDWTAGDDLTGWTFTPQVASTCAVSGGYLLYTSDGVGGFTINNRLVYDTYGTTMLSNWTVVLNMVCPSLPQASSSAIGVGVYGYQPIGTPVSTHGMTYWQSGYTGVASVWTQNTQRGANSGQLASCVAGDNIRLTFTRVNEVYTLTVDNTTRSTTVSSTWTEPYTSTAALNNTVAKPFIQFGKGTFQIKSFSFSSSSQKNVDYGFIGNSIPEAYCASNYANAWPAQAMIGNPKTYTKLASQSSYTANTLTSMPEILNVHARKYVVMLGGNDVQLAVPDATMKANYSSIVSQLKAGGSQVIHCYAPPRDSYDMRALNAWILATFPSDVVIDTFTPLVTAPYALNNTYDIGDGVHPNIAGHALIGSTVAPYLV